MNKERDVRYTDKYGLYSAAFQNPAYEIHMIAKEYSGYFGVSPRILREDFCGTFANGIAWVGLGDENISIGVDIDEPTLDVGKQLIDEELTEDEKRRTKLILGSVLDQQLPEADIVASLNCSCCYFWKRSEFKCYLSKCLDSLKGNGMTVLEIYCGADAYNLGCDEIRIPGATAIWEQAAFDPVTNRCLNYVHFKLDDGKLIERAFEYDFRLWSPPECVDLLEEVGFRAIKVLNVTQQKENLNRAVDSSATLFIFGFKHD